MIHDRLRKSVDSRPRTVDGVLNAPVRSSVSQARTPGGAVPSQRRVVDGFRRKEGFHAVNHARTSASRSAVPSGRPQGTSGDSILHMSLPGGSFGDGKARGARNRPGRRSKWSAFRRWTLRSAAALSVLALVVGGFLVVKAYLSAGQVFQGGGQAAALSCSNEVEPAKLEREGDGRINVLLLGEDNEASLTDSILVASIDPISKSSSMVSIPRDFWVTTQQTGSTKVNAVYPLVKQAALSENPKNEREAEKKAVEALKLVAEEVLGIPIHYYVTVDVAGFERAVEVTGGVTMNVPENLAVSEHMWDDVRNQPYYLNVPAGNQKFDAQRALFFVRSRKTSTRGDFDRAERQRLFLRSLASQLLSAGTYTNPVKINQLMDTFSDSVVTSFSVDDALCLAKTGQDMDVNAMASVDMAGESNQVVTTGFVNGQSIVQPTAGVADYSQIQALIRKSFKDGYLVREKASVVVLNGSGIAGRAKQLAAELKSYGYNVIRTGDAPTQDYQQTVLTNLRGTDKRYTEHYLSKRLGVQAGSELPQGVTLAADEQADIVIVIGNQ